MEIGLSWRDLQWSMETKAKIILTTLIFGIIGFVFLSPHGPPGNAIWPEVQGPEPTGAAVPLLIGYGALSALGSGFGIGFFLFGRAWTASAFPKMTGAAHLALSFIPASFWFHDNLHAVNGENMAGIAALEYGFHLPIMVSALVIVVAMAKSAPLRTTKTKRDVVAHATPGR